MVPDAVFPEPLHASRDGSAPVGARAVRECCRLLQTRAGELRRIPAGARVEKLGRFTRRWLDHDYPHRRLATRRIVSATGFSTQVVEEGLDALFRAWSAEAMTALLETEFAGALCTDHAADSNPPEVMVPRLEGGARIVPSRRNRGLTAIPPRLVGHILAGNVHPPALQSLLAALLVGSPSFLKAPSAEPWFATSLVRSLREEVPDLGRFVAVATWPGEQTSCNEVLLHEADIVVAFGSDSTVQEIRRMLPARTRLVVRSHRVSVGYVAREVMTRGQVPEVARAFASDVALFDQQGCLSPHAILVETGGDLEPVEFARELAGRALPGIARVLPPRQLGLAEGADLLQFKGVQSLSGTVLPSAGGAVVVTHAERISAPGPGRTLFVRPVATLEEALAYLGPILDNLQGVAVAAGERRWGEVARCFALSGATRICAPGTLQSPPACWPGDGLRPLGALVRWVSLEPRDSPPGEPSSKR